MIQDIANHKIMSQIDRNSDPLSVSDCDPNEYEGLNLSREQVVELVNDEKF